MVQIGTFLSRFGAKWFFFETFSQFRTGIVAMPFNLPFHLQGVC
jgi:hypothetical protein